MIGDGQHAAVARVLSAFAQRLPPDARAAIREAREHSVPLHRLTEGLPAALSADEDWSAAAAADRERAARLQRAAHLVARALAGVPGAALSESVLGEGWAADVDVYVEPGLTSAVGEALVGRAAVALDGLAAALAGAPADGPVRHFAVIEGGEVLGAVELVATLWDGGENAAHAISRAVPGPDGAARLRPEDVTRRRSYKLAATRRPTVRGVAELTLLVERGVRLPRPIARGVLRRHARLERELIGPGPLSAAVRAQPRRAGATRVWVAARARAVRREARRRLRRRAQWRVAFVGIDGAGKSTQVAALVANLRLAGIPAAATWMRLGNKAMRPVEIVVGLVQRLLPAGTHSYESTREAAGREAPEAATPVAASLSRRGPLGWAWALVVTVDYLVRARTAYRRAAGRVLVLDRALPDALVELEDNYGVALELRLQRRLLERWTPRPHLLVHLRLPGAAAKARKDDTFTARELDAHLVRYDRLLASLPNVVTLDAQQPRDELAAAVLRAVASAAQEGARRP